jgi:CheY-like chemotaxis protein
MQNELLHVLVIDDNEDVLYMLKAMLEMKGYRISAKDSPENIVPFIENEMPDLILMDMLLSGNDGREVCKIIKQHNAIAQIPLIIISAMPDAAESCINAGADYFLGKPFEMTELFDTVAAALPVVEK